MTVHLPTPLAWIPVKERFTEADDGLTQQWKGRVWMNPPYSKPGPWVERFRHHGNGVGLVPCSKAYWFDEMWSDPSVTLCFAPANLKFVGGSIYMSTVFIAAGASNIAALRNLGHVR